MNTALNILFGDELNDGLQGDALLGIRGLVEEVLLALEVFLLQNVKFFGTLVLNKLRVVCVLISQRLILGVEILHCGEDGIGNDVLDLLAVHSFVFWGRGGEVARKIFVQFSAQIIKLL